MYMYHVMSVNAIDDRNCQFIWVYTNHPPSSTKDIEQLDVGIFRQLVIEENKLLFFIEFVREYYETT